MLGKNASLGAINNQGSVVGVVLRVFAARKVCKNINAMDHLEEKLGMNVY